MNESDESPHPHVVPGSHRAGIGLALLAALLFGASSPLRHPSAPLLADAEVFD